MHDSSNITPEPITTSTTAGIDVVLPENRYISMPSTWGPEDNPSRVMELELRMEQAARTLKLLRDLIADKSFQFSHIIRVAPRKSVHTRARSAIAQLNYRIGYHCRIYGRCRSALVKLGADTATLAKYRPLLCQDIRSSTAMLNPNEPGSTRHQLSWIWQSRSTANCKTSEGLREFNRVHWLRARAQHHRWKEELILVGYEMGWTVRYYMYQSGIWMERRTVAVAAGDNGAAAYAARKAAMWMDISATAGAQFQEVSPLYKETIS
ncbi:hypothetical protein BYT27DRAFT_7076625 [Phlegmacium glaucopus]|nr:hypothetical protein BYT27DRAFT_7076625 [Phlegmacium glaucopus]